nr:hypothetical protein [Actinomycetales bacterium]
MRNRKVLHGVAVAAVLCGTIGLTRCSAEEEQVSVPTPAAAADAAPPPRSAPKNSSAAAQAGTADVHPDFAALSPPEWDELPEIPAGLTDDEEGAAAFLLYAIELLNYSQKHAEPAALAQVAGPECTFCDAMIATYQRLQDTGSRRIGGLATFAVESVEHAPTGEYLVGGVMVVEEVREYSPEEGQVWSSGINVIPGTLQVGIIDGQWYFLEAGNPRGN